MNTPGIAKLVIRSFAAAIFAIGFAPWTHAGVISSGDYLSAEVRAERISEFEVFLARAEVAEQLEGYGVSQEQVFERIQNLSNQELLELQGRIDELAAGGSDLIAILGIVFVVLLVLDLVGVTDVFSSIG